MIISESRKFNIRPFLSNQGVQQLDRANQAAVAAAGVLIAFRVSGPDGKAIAGNFDTTPKGHAVIGTEPVRSPVADIVGHLVRRGHVHPVVNAFASEYLAPLEAFLQQVRTYLHPIEFGSSECRTGDVLEARRILNDVLFQAMQMGRGTGRSTLGRSSRSRALPMTVAAMCSTPI